MNNVAILKLNQEILKIKDKATERSYYPVICNFLKEFAEIQKKKNFFATAEESSTVIKKGIGFPDITARQGNHLIGWIEIKLPKDNLNNEKFSDQFDKYKDALENILFTNLREWQLWQWDDKGKATKVKEIIFDISDFAIGEEEKLENILIEFFEGRPYEARTPKQLALALAKKTKLLSKQVEEAYSEDDKDSDLVKLKSTFEKTLIQNISVHQFANMVAETMSYSLFLAFLEHVHRGNGTELTLTNAIDYLPTNVPILADLYSLVNKVSKTIPTIHQSIFTLIDQLESSDMDRIYNKLVEHKPGEDPVIQFYEPFLKEYDPVERESRGVYYTPKPVVDYIVRSVDYILRDKFGKNKGLADDSVHLLDPATGTGTFLMSAIQEIYSNIKKENKTLGDEIVEKEFNNIVVNHILKHFYGFELLIAPYAIAHLKLTLLLEDLGFNFEITKNDGDPDNDRLKVYLANTLDDPNKPPQLDLPGYHIAEETSKANEVKKTKPIIAILGNPPYSGISLNMQDSMRQLVERYKFIGEERIREKGALQFEKNLNDDYIKFISFAQSLVEKNKFGVIALITNNGYLDSPTLRGLRYNLLQSFDKLYFLNLCGSTKKGNKDKKGGKDESVFNIQLGTAIMFLVKNKTKLGKKEVYYYEKTGSRLDKFEFLLRNNIQTVKWKKIDPKDDKYFFVPMDEKKESEYKKYYDIQNIFCKKSIGIITARDNFIINEDKGNLLDNVNSFGKNINLPNGILCQKLNISQKKGWNIDNAKKSFAEIEDIENYIKKIAYRPFDSRYIFYHKSLIWGMSHPIMKNFIVDDNNNVGIILCRQVNEDFSHIFIANKLVESSYISNKTKEINNIFPLYIYDDKNSQQASLLSKVGVRVPNLSSNFIKKFSSKLKLNFVSDGKGDLKKIFGPEDIFYYSYAIFHCPTYRSRYAEQLKIDFPRLPLISDKRLFKILGIKGNELVNLHLLGENPFDKSKTIFDSPSKWNVKIGGEKSDNIDDWEVTEVRYNEKEKRVYINKAKYFEGIEKEVWEFMIGGYQVCEKWLKDRKKAERSIKDELKHYMKIIVSIRETIRIMKEIDKLIPKWPME
ncbi:N-6 DNA methylase [Patescibacteria group bacterium]|nr:N-6 DNA methylase [Patescibacteria group bacterium]